MQAGGLIESSFSSNGANGDGETIFLCMVQDANSVYNRYLAYGTAVTFPIIGEFGSSPNNALGATIQGQSNLAYYNGPGALIHLDGMVEWEGTTYNKAYPYNIPAFYSNAASCTRPECQNVSPVTQSAINVTAKNADGFVVSVAQSKITITSERSLYAQLDLYTASGRKVLSLSNQQLKMGVNSLALPASMGTGLFLLKISGEGQTVSRRVSIQ